MWPNNIQTDFVGKGCNQLRVTSHQILGIQVKDSEYKKWLHLLYAKYSCLFLVAGCCFPFPILGNSLSSMKVQWWITETPQGENCAPRRTPVERATMAVPSKVGLLGTQPFPPRTALTQVTVMLTICFNPTKIRVGNLKALKEKKNLVLPLTQAIFLQIFKVQRHCVFTFISNKKITLLYLITLLF